MDVEVTSLLVRKVALSILINMGVKRTIGTYSSKEKYIQIHLSGNLLRQLLVDSRAHVFSMCRLEYCTKSYLLLS